jgi:excisionase family DNA binding protein
MKTATVKDPRPPRPGPLMSVEQAAEYLGVRPGTLRNWLSARRIAYVKVGRLTRISSETLNRFIAEHTVTSVEDLKP